MGLSEYEQDEQLLRDFQRRHKAAQDARKSFDTKCDVIDRHYEPFNPAVRWPDSGTEDEMLRAPHIFHIIETMSSNMIEPDPDWDVRPRQFTFEESVKASRKGLSWAMEKDGWGRKVQRLVRQGNRYGLAVAHIMWEFEDEVEVEQREAPHPNLFRRMMGQTITQEHHVQRVLRDDATVRLVDKRDFWWQPGASDLEDAEWVHHRTWVPLPVLEELEEQGLYQNVAHVSKGSTGDHVGVLEHDEADKERRRADTDGVEVVTEYNKTTGMILVVANNRCILRHDEFPYDHEQFPFAAYVPIPMEGRFEGISPVEPLIKLQDRTWVMEDDRMKAVALALNPTLLVAKALKGSTDFHIQSGGRIYVDDPSQVQQIQIQPNAGMGFEEVQAYLGYMQQVSGVSPYIAGSDASGYGIDNNTATGVNRLSEAAGRRIGFHIIQLQECVQRIGYQVLALMQQFMTEDRMVRVVGEQGAEWIKLSPEDIPEEFDVIVKGSTESLNKQFERQQLQELVQTVREFHGLPDEATGRMFTMVPAVNRLVETFDLNPDEFWPAQGEQTQGMQQAQLQQQQAQAMQAQGDAAMADPQMQMQMQQMQQQPQPGPNDFNGDGIDDIQRKAFESMNFKDMPVDAQAALLEARGLPSQGLMEQHQLEQQLQLAKIRQMTAQAQMKHAGQDNA